MIPLTPEQVARLRMPEGYVLIDGPHGWYWTRDMFVPDSTRTDKALAHVAQYVANGHIPPEALDDVWRRVDGRPSKEAELLRAVVESYNAAVQARHVHDAYHEPSTTPDDQYRAAVATLAADQFRGALSVARAWIEEQKP